jgi:lactoylglutathione lyase
MPVTGLSHIGIYTKEMDKSIHFYSDILGFVMMWEGIVDHPTGKVKAAVMGFGNCVIELVRPVDLDRVNNSAGPVQHLALKVKDLEAMITELRAQGFDFTTEGLEFLPTFYIGIKHAFIYGPSNERIELVEDL